jgi:hypothetical protein
MTRLLTLAASLLTLSASADPYDFQIFKLGNPQNGAGSVGYNAAANGNFRVFARYLAAGLTSSNLAPPGSLGHSGMAISIENTLPFYNSDPNLMPIEGKYGGPFINIPTVHIRKGLPLSFEIGGKMGWYEKSRMGVGTLELKWAINEGFTYLPDIAVRGSITKLINSRDFDVTVGGVDLGIGKQFAIGGMITLTPYVGWNLLFVGASTDNVDFNPNRTPAMADDPTMQFTNIYTYDSLPAISNSHNRFYGGLRFKAAPLVLTAEVSYSVIGKFKDKTTNADREVPSLLALNGAIGLEF